MHYTKAHGSWCSILGWALAIIGIIGGYWFALQLQGTIAAVSVVIP